MKKKTQQPGNKGSDTGKWQMEFVQNYQKDIPRSVHAGSIHENSQGAGRWIYWKQIKGGGVDIGRQFWKFH